MCRRVLAWLDQTRKAGDGRMVAVNISGRSLGSAEFIAEFFALLTAHPWAAGRLLFELTESSTISDLERTNRVIQALRRLGHPVCLDDFGAGEAAFRYLRGLEVDIVKIDGSYVRDALRQARDRYFLKSIAGLCRDLGIHTVGEMVENEETAELLRRCGVRFGQGFLFGRPSFDITTFDVRRSLGPGPARAAAEG